MEPIDELFERAEREGGGRWDDPNSNALAILFGAVAREAGKAGIGPLARPHRYTERDDMALGLLIQDEIENGDARRERNAALAALLGLGISPDELKELFG